MTVIMKIFYLLNMCFIKVFGEFSLIIVKILLFIILNYHAETLGSYSRFERLCRLQFSFLFSLTVRENKNNLQNVSRKQLDNFELFK